MNKSGVYAVISPSGKRYIGSSVNVYTRFVSHKRDRVLGCRWEYA